LRQGGGRAPETGPPSNRLLDPPGRFTDSLWESARRSENWALVATNFTTFGGFLALTSWLPTYWAVYHGLSLPVAAFFTAVGFTLFGAFMRVLGGFASDLHGGETVQLLNHALVVVGALTLFLSGTSIGESILGELVLAAGMGMANGGVYKLIPRYMPESLGGAMGWVGGIGSLGGFVIPPVLGSAVGELRDVGYSEGFVLFVGLGSMSFGISLWLRAGRHRRLSSKPRGNVKSSSAFLP
jgi:MFS transporter, NNP family, nitrate/nitrite transporter